MNTKIMIFDIDGTILDKKKHKIANSTIEAISKAKEIGIKIILATGRPYWSIEEDIIKKMQPDGYVTLNGHLIVDNNGEILYKKPLNPDLVVELEAFARENLSAYGFHMGSQTILYKDHILEQTIHQLLNQTLNVIQSVDHKEHLNQDVYCFIFYEKNHEKILAISKKFPELRMDSFSNDCYDFFDYESNKQKGIEFFLSRWGLTWDESVAFGDSTNDIEMLKAARFSYLVKSNNKSMNNLNVKRIGRPLSGEISSAIYRHLPSASISLSSDNMLQKMNGNRIKISLLISAAFFVNSINEFMIKQEQTAGFVYLGLSLVMLIVGIIAYRKEFN